MVGGAIHLKSGNADMFMGITGHGRVSTFRKRCVMLFLKGKGEVNNRRQPRKNGVGHGTKREEVQSEKLYHAKRMCPKYVVSAERNSATLTRAVIVRSILQEINERIIITGRVVLHL